MSRNISHILYISFFTIIALFFVGLIPVFAQTTNSPSISMTATPQIPNPGDTVTLTISSDTLNLATTKITWYVDGNAVQGNIGLTQFSVQAKNSGEQTIVKAIAQTADGTTTEISQIISPASVDLIVEPTSYTPPFYKGKPLFVNQGTARIVAIPNIVINGNTIPASNLIFRWTQDDTVLGASSGVGKNTITINGAVPIRDITISVNVLDATGNLVAQNSKIISATNPEVIFYEDSPLYGVLYNEAIMKNYYLGNREELDILAEPYFFNFTTDTEKNASYTWLVNNTPVNPSEKNNELIMKQTTKNLSGTASVSLDLTNLTKIFQFASANFNVQFGQ